MSGHLRFDDVVSSFCLCGNGVHVPLLLESARMTRNTKDKT